MSTAPREMIDRLDARHEQLLRKLDELNTEIERVLADSAHSRPPCGNSAEALQAD